MTGPAAPQPERPLSATERQALREMAAGLASTDPQLAERLDQPPAMGMVTALLLGAVLAMVLFTALESLLSAVLVLIMVGPCAWLLGRHFDQLIRQRR